MNFNDKKVADKYKPETNYNHKVHVPGIFSGPLKDLTAEAADALVKQGSNLLSLKVGVPVQEKSETPDPKSNKNVKSGSVAPLPKGTDQQP